MRKRDDESDDQFYERRFGGRGEIDTVFFFKETPWEVPAPRARTIQKLTCGVNNDKKD